MAQEEEASKGVDLKMWQVLKPAVLFSKEVDNQLGGYNKQAFPVVLSRFRVFAGVLQDVPRMNEKAWPLNSLVLAE